MLKNNYKDYINDKWWGTLEPVYQYVLLKHINYDNTNSIIDFYEQISKIEVINCSNLKLDSLKFLCYCFNLRVLDCTNNFIRNLEGLEYCINLEYLNCSGNYIENLVELKNCYKLRILKCTNIKLLRLKGLENSFNLEEIYCTNNNLCELNEISNCFKLRIAHFNNNYIKDLTVFKNLINIEFIKISGNRIDDYDEELSHLICCTKLISIELRSVNQLIFSYDYIYNSYIKNVQSKKYYSRYPYGNSTIISQLMLLASMA